LTGREVGHQVQKLAMGGTMLISRRSLVAGTVSR
jgi:hypothetical protein